MGIYYKVACDDLKESICPGNINDLGIKSGAIANPNHPFGAVVIFAMTYRWSRKKVRLITDTGYGEDEYYTYTDVTEQILNEYNEMYGTLLRFTGGEGE